MYTLIGAAKLNDVDPQARFADVLARIAEIPQTRLHELLPWRWKAERQQDLAAQPAACAGCSPCIQVTVSRWSRVAHGSPATPVARISEQHF